VDSSIDSDVPATDGPTVDGESTIDGAAGTDGTGGTGGTGGEPEGGCGGCTVSGQPDGSVLLFGLFVVGLAFRRRQRNR
jgi:MYXO-CTERM domain-containing protein